MRVHDKKGVLIDRTLYTEYDMEEINLAVDKIKNTLRIADKTIRPSLKGGSGVRRSHLLSRLARQSRQRRTHRIPRFLPCPLYFAQLFEGDNIRERITRKAIRDCRPGIENLEQSVQPRSSLLF